MKWVIYAVLLLGVAFGWIRFMGQGEDRAKSLQDRITQIEQRGSQAEMEEIPGLRNEIRSIKDGKTLTGIMLAFVTAGVLGIIFVVDLLPVIAHKFTHAVYDSGEEVEEDPMHDGRAKLAQGDYEGAIEAFREAAVAEPSNRLPYVEIAKVQRQHLHDAQAAARTLREAVEGQEWEVNDAAFLMFRLAEVYDEDLSHRESAVAVLEQVVEQFPDTRHSANARHKLHEWGVA
jgi:tetratricopeptide (TPR) repeat protein